jgi:AraC-like DNA-binding protein
VIDEHARHVPPTWLRPFVSGYTGYRQEGVAPLRHRGLPSPELTFIVTLDDPLAIDAHPDPGQPAESYDTLLGGLHTSPALVSHQGRWSGVQLGLTPLGARTLLGLPAGELANWDAEATDVVGAFAARLRELVVEQPTWAGRFAVIDQLLDRRAAEAEADRRATVRPEVGYAWRRLRETRGGVGVAELAAETGLSARRLGSLFRDEFGLAPKEAGRVFRFTYARRRIGQAAMGGRLGARGGGGTAGGGTAGGDAGPDGGSAGSRGTAGGGAEGGGAAGRRAGATLARLAAECGYYDQAHLAREFRALAGCPPSVWLAEEFRFVQASAADLGE